MEKFKYTKYDYTGIIKKDYKYIDYSGCYTIQSVRLEDNMLIIDYLSHFNGIQSITSTINLNDYTETDNIIIPTQPTR